MAKEKTKGEEFSAIGKQTMAHAYSAMDWPGFQILSSVE